MPFWLPWCTVSKPLLATYVSAESPGHGALGPQVRPLQSVQTLGWLRVPWICRQASRLSNLGRVLPPGWARRCPTPTPTQTSLPPLTSMAQ